MHVRKHRASRHDHRGPMAESLLQFDEPILNPCVPHIREFKLHIRTYEAKWSRCSTQVYLASASYN